MQPILFSIGDIPIRAWGVMVALGIMPGLWLTARLAKGSKYTEEMLLDYTLYAVITGFLGARLWEVVFSWEHYAAAPWHALMFWEGGLSIQGAVLANLILAWWYFRRQGLSVRRFADFAAPGLILGQAIGRIGCFLNGDAFGQPTNAWYGVIYQPGTAAYAAWGPTPLVPAELFEALADLVILGVLLYYHRRKNFDGQIALLYLLLYSAARFGLEFVRTDSLMLADFKVAQLTAAATMVAAGLIWLWWAQRRVSGGENETV